MRVDIVETLVNKDHIQFDKAHLLWSLRGRVFLHSRKILPPATTTASNQTSGTTNCSTAGPHWATAYTDGSLSVSTEKNEKTVTGYGGVFRFGPLDGKEFCGYSHAMSTLSTLGEAMAIAVALGETPKDMLLTIYSDSTAAIAKVNRGKKRWVKPKKRPAHNSPLDWVCSLARKSVLERTTPTTFEWIKGHSGIEGNERADSLAKFAAPEPPPVSRFNI